MNTDQIFNGRVLRTSVLRTQARFYIGVDLGQAQDFSAITVIERAEVVGCERDPVTYEYLTETLFHLRHAERIPLGSPYPEIVERVKEIAGRTPVAGWAKVIVDATGVGAPVVDLLKRAGLKCPVIPVVITSGDMESSNGSGYRVPKRDLMAGLQVAFQKKRLRLARGMRGLDALVEELRAMRVRMSPEGYERFSGGGTHDDLVLSLALAWWRASREAGWGC
ncbi:MAG: hypothetical protein H7Y20_14755 [Bryobacteraceae bacterium]|nr:hypothetical protein [Bryobacteraceae bacterium]